MARDPRGRVVRDAARPGQAPQPANTHGRPPEATPPGGEAMPCQTLLENLVDGFIALDRGYRCTYINKAAAAFLNTTADQLRGRPLWDALSGPRYPQLKEGITRAVEQRIFVKLEEYCELCGHWYEWHCCPADDSLVIFLEDVSERKEAEEQATRSAQQHRLLFETMPQGVVYQDAHGQDHLHESGGRADSRPNTARVPGPNVRGRGAPHPAGRRHAVSGSGASVHGGPADGAGGAERGHGGVQPAGSGLPLDQYHRRAPGPAGRRQALPGLHTLQRHHRAQAGGERACARANAAFASSSKRT